MTLIILLMTTKTSTAQTISSSQTESYFQYQNSHHYLIHSGLAPNLPTLLIIHGLGDSSLNYREFLSLTNYNVLIPDLLGYGKSSGAGDYSCNNQVNAIIHHINHLQKESGIALSNITLLAHSMGAIVATLLCESDLKSQIKALISVEGSGENAMQNYPCVKFIVMVILYAKKI
jgi:pimeloyl-ACP methyl ester carboxylesterase